MVGGKGRCAAAGGSEPVVGAVRGASGVAQEPPRPIEVSARVTPAENSTTENSNMVKFKINGRLVWFMTDSGAQRSVLLPQHVSGGIEPTETRLRTITGQPIPLLGEAEVELCAGKRCVTHTFMIPPPGDLFFCDGILGLDFLTKHKCSLDLVKQRLNIGPDGYSVRLHPARAGVQYTSYGVSLAEDGPPAASPSPPVKGILRDGSGVDHLAPAGPAGKAVHFEDDYAVWFKEETIIPGKGHVVLWGCTGAPPHRDFVCWSQPQCDKIGLLGARSIVRTTADHRCPVLLLNLSDDSVTFQAGQPVVHITPLLPDDAEGVHGVLDDWEELLTTESPGDKTDISPAGGRKNSPPSPEPGDARKLQREPTGSSAEWEEGKVYLRPPEEEGRDGDTSVPGAECVQHLDLSHLPEAQATELRALLARYSRLFDKYTMEGAPDFSVRIPLKTEDPIRVRQYPLARAHIDFLRQEMDKMQKLDVVEESTSLSNLPILCVRKPTPPGAPPAYRFVLDARKLNEQLRDEIYVDLPRISDALESLAFQKYYTTLDLSHGFYNLKVHPDDRHKLAFSIPGVGRFQLKRLPQGLRSSSFQFQLFINKLLVDLIGNAARAYQDDVIIFSRSWPDHMTSLEAVLERLDSANLRLNGAKCHFAKEKVKYLGFVVSQEGVAPDPSKLEPLRSVQRLENVRQVRSFLGLVAFFKNHVPGLYMHCEKLIHLTRKGVPFVWGPEQQKAFDAVKKALTEDPVVLAFPDFDRPFHLYTDSSQSAIGAGLLQEDKNGRLRVISYFSKIMSKAERNFSVLEQEGLAVISALRHFIHYLLDTKHPVVLHTDNRALTFLHSFKDPTSRIARWAVFLSMFNLQVVGLPGSENGLADFLSRKPETVAGLREDEGETDYTPIFWDWRTMRDLQHKDKYCALKLFELGAERGQAVGNYTTDARGLLYKVARPVDLLVVPAAGRHLVLELTHDLPLSGHYGQTLTFRRTARTFWWKGLKRDVQDYVASCHVCLTSTKGHPPKAPIVRVKIPLRPFQTCHFDLIGPLSADLEGNKYILVHICAFSKFLVLVPMPNMEGATIAKCMIEHIFSKYGLVSTLISDRAPNLLAGILREVTNALGIKRLATSAYQPSSNGLCERVNKDVMRVITGLITADGLNWGRAAFLAAWAHNNAIHSSTQEIPFHAVFMREGHLPISVLQPVRPNYSEDDNYTANTMRELQRMYLGMCRQLASAQSSRAVFFNRKSRGGRIHVGDLVYLVVDNFQLTPSRKLQRPFCGPWRVVDLLSNGVNARISPVFPLSQTWKERVVHINKLRKAAVRIQPDGSLGVDGQLSPLSDPAILDQAATPAASVDPLVPAPKSGEEPVRTAVPAVTAAGSPLPGPGAPAPPAGPHTRSRGPPPLLPPYRGRL